MSAPALWCEARCHYVCAPPTPCGRIGCRETAPGAFGPGNATREAKAAGWRVVAGEWCCPTCYKVLSARQGEGA
jgi:hypothetical protein